MKQLIQFFIKYSTWPNVIKMLTIMFGLAAAFSLKTSFFPERENRLVLIQAVYPGASPEEIEKGIVRRIEDNLKGVLGIERYTSNSRENMASINVEILKGHDVDEALQDVKNAVDRINSFPAGMEPPVIFKQPTIEFAINFSLSGDVDVKTLKTIARQAEDDLRGIDGISQVSIEGFPPEEIVISVREEDMRTYGLTFDQVTRAVAQSNLDLSSGSIKTKDEEILIRLEGKRYYGEELQDIVVKSDKEGRIVRIRDIAVVENTWAESPQKTIINDNRAAIISVSKILGEDIIHITDNVKNYVKEFNKKNKQVKANIIDDRTISLRERIGMLSRNGLLGAMLVLIALALFLNIRLAFWVALGLPFSFLGMMLLLYLAGITINVISLFGCIIVVGILVDDGIVIAEQIYQNHEKGMKAFSAAYNGTLQVLPSVVFAVLTTIVAFVPFFFLDGRMGEMMRDMAFVVTVTIFFSLIEASLILPSHLAHSKALRGKIKDSGIRKKLDRILLYPRDIWYAKALQYFLKNWYLVIAIAVFLTLVTFGAFKGGLIGLNFFPFLDQDNFEISLVMPAGTREQITEDILERIEKSAWEVNEDFKAKRDDGKDVIINTIINLARQPSGLFGAVEEGNGNVGTIKVVLLSGDLRNIDSYIIQNAIREKTGPVPEAERLTFGEGSRWGKPVSIPIMSPDLADLDKAKDEIKKGLNSMPELTGIIDDSPEGMREIKIKLKEKANLLGLTSLEIARQIRQGFFGAEVQRLQRGPDEVKVWVKYTKEDRDALKKWEDMRIRIQDGLGIPLRELVDYDIKRGPTVINHLNGNRVITVEADLVDVQAELPPILARVNSEILEPIFNKYPSVETTESGQRREVMKTARSSSTALPVAFIIMFFLIVLSFRSFTQAIIVIMLIPLGLIGAAWGHFIHGIPVNMMSAYGILALIGIIVNNSIVFINTANQNLRDGMKFDDAIYNAGINRFRPILLTTITTVLGLLPLVLETSRQAQFLIPMAISVSYGLLFGASFTLVFLPVYLKLMNRTKWRLKMLFTGEDMQPRDVEPAIKEMKNLKEYFGDINGTEK
ncbi:efflux RND transporter permease subunit [Bacteroidota bacterium]